MQPDDFQAQPLCPLAQATALFRGNLVGTFGKGEGGNFHAIVAHLTDESKGILQPPTLKDLVAEGKADSHVVPPPPRHFGTVGVL